MHIVKIFYNIIENEKNARSFARSFFAIFKGILYFCSVKYLEF